MNQRIRNSLAAAGLMLSAMGAGAANYSAILTGQQEAPPNTSPGIGASTIRFDPTAHLLEINVTFSGLVGETYAAHIHCCTPTPGEGIAGVMTPIPNLSGFPQGVRSGVYTYTYDTSLASSWSPSFLSSWGNSTAFAEAAFENGLQNGTAYFNIHTSYASAGEVRGFYEVAPAAAVPEPESIALLSIGLPVLLILARRRPKNAIKLK
ncbi:PEP-CTERM protein-sorting domain-containing protein [Duganella sp. CF517]|uniref:CHRD domain-containing protein n=1 Tax=Duganella sp. CF517 TaxID=1881038 RepID=UPI0008C326A9|nr:CHRD domain-containing protein [Duganella sp. CF517]SEN23491.1 PEP-CTERM protein-sorting domain-containing protein [Duganella sp. CF517]